MFSKKSKAEKMEVGSDAEEEVDESDVSDDNVVIESE